MTPWESTFLCTTTADNQIVVVPCPGRCIIDRIGIVMIGGGSVAANFYNRAFLSPASPTPVKSILNAYGNSGVCEFTMPLVFAVKVGDVVTVSDANQTDYNVSSRVTNVLDDKHFITDMEYVSDEYAASTQIDIPSAEQNLYIAFPPLTGTNYAEAKPSPGTYVNQDPQTNQTNRGYPMKLYVSLGSPATYRISIRARQGVAMGD